MRVGRTGRAGARGASWTFVTPIERSDVRNYERTLGIQVQYRELFCIAAADWTDYGCGCVFGFDEGDK